LKESCNSCIINNNILKLAIKVCGGYVMFYLLVKIAEIENNSFVSNSNAT